MCEPTMPVCELMWTSEYQRKILNCSPCTWNFTYLTKISYNKRDEWKMFPFISSICSVNEDTLYKMYKVFIKKKS